MKNAFAFVLAAVSAFYFPFVLGALHLMGSHGFTNPPLWPPLVLWLVIALIAGFFALRFASRAVFVVLPCLLLAGWVLFNVVVRRGSLAGLSPALVMLVQAGGFWLLMRRNPRPAES